MIIGPGLSVKMPGSGRVLSVLWVTAEGEVCVLGYADGPVIFAPGKFVSWIRGASVVAPANPNLGMCLDHDATAA